MRPAERTQRELASSLADAEWSAAAAKLASQSSGAGRTVRTLGVRHERKCPLCEARGKMLKFGKAKRANRNAVQVRQREERSDETSTKLSAIAADIDA